MDYWQVMDVLFSSQSLLYSRVQYGAEMSILHIACCDETQQVLLLIAIPKLFLYTITAYSKKKIKYIYFEL